MRVLIQRVSSARVEVRKKTIGQINQGLLLLVGFEEEDNQDDIDWIIRKVSQMRIFGDEEGKMNTSLTDFGGDTLIVSQFTLHASTKKGNRPSFIRSASPERALALYEQFIERYKINVDGKVETGIFGEDMQVSLINDGPVTIWIDSKNRE